MGLEFLPGIEQIAADVRPGSRHQPEHRGGDDTDRNERAEKTHERLAAIAGFWIEPAWREHSQE